MWVSYLPAKVWLSYVSRSLSSLLSVSIMFWWWILFIASISLGVSLCVAMLHIAYKDLKRRK